MHSEHILKERSDAQNVVSRFPYGMQPFYTTCGVSRHHHPLNLLNPLNPVNLHTEGVSNEPSHRRRVHTHTFAFISYFE